MQSDYSVRGVTHNPYITWKAASRTINRQQSTKPTSGNGGERGWMVVVTEGSSSEYKGLYRCEWAYEAVEFGEISLGDHAQMSIRIGCDSIHAHRGVTMQEMCGTRPRNPSTTELWWACRWGLRHGFRLTVLLQNGMWGNLQLSLSSRDGVHIRVGGFTCGRSYLGLVLHKSCHYLPSIGTLPIICVSIRNQS